MKPCLGDGVREGAGNLAQEAKGWLSDINGLGEKVALGKKIEDAAIS